MPSISGSLYKLSGYLFFHCVGGQAVSARKIDQSNIQIMVFNGTLYFLNGYTWPVCHFQICTGVSIEKCCLSAVRISDEADSQIFSHRNLPH